MKTLFKFVGVIFAILALVIVVLLLIPDQQYKRFAQSSLTKLTQRPVSIGELTTQRGLMFAVTLNDITLSNPQWAEKQPMINTKQFNAQLNIVELLKGKLNIDLSSQSMNIDLIRNKDGQANWQFKDSESSPAEKTAGENPPIKSLARLVLKHLNMDDFKLVYDDEKTSAHHELLIKNMNVIESEDGIAQTVKLDGSFNQLPLTLKGSTGTFQSLNNTHKLPIDLQAALDNFTLSLNGEIDAQSDMLNLLSTFNLAADDLSLISKFTNQKLPSDWKDITGTGKLLSSEGVFSLKDLQLNMDGGLNVDIAGGIDNLNEFKNIDVNVKAQLNSAQSLSVFTDAPLPELGPFKFKGNVKSENEFFALKHALLSYSGEYGDANIAGDIGDLIKLNEANLKADIKLPNLNIAKLFTDTEIPELGNIDLVSDIVSNGPLDLSAHQLKLNYDHQGLKVNATGSINSLIKKAGELDLDVNLSVESLAALDTLAKRKLPAIGPVDLTTKVTGAFTDIRVNQIVTQLKDKYLTGKIIGDVGSIYKLDEIKIDANLESSSLGDLLNKLDVTNSIKKPAKLSVNVNQVNEGISLSDLSLAIEDNSMTGNIDLGNILNKTSRPNIKGKLNLVKFDLNDVIDSNQTKTPDTESKQTGFQLSDEPLPFDYIRNYDVDIALDIGKFTSSFMNLSDTTVNLVANQGQLKLGPVNANLNGGDTTLGLNIDASKNPAVVSLDSKVDNFSIKQAGTFEGSELLENDGTADASLKLTGTGESIASILGTSNGDGFVDIKNLTIKSDLIKFVSADFAKETVGALTNSEEKSKHTVLNCTAFKINVEQGQLSTAKGYIVDAKPFTITGDAKVNLKDQGLDITVNTNPKEGLGLGLGEIARAIKIDGTISAPKIGLNPKGIAEIGLSVAAAAATGGTSLLVEGQIGKLKAKSELCANVLQ